MLDLDSYRSPDNFEDKSIDRHVCQNTWEFNALLDIYRELNTQDVLEIGSAYGGTLYQFMKNINFSYGNFLAVDYNEFNFPTEYFDVWKAWASKFHVQLDYILGDSHSDEVFNKVKSYFPDGIEFIFIDGDHSYAGSTADFEMYKELIIEGGIIAMHDIASPGNEVPRTWRDIKNYGYKTRELHFDINNPSLGIGVVYF